MVEQIHTDIFHYERLNSLCRICGERSKRSRDSMPAKQCKNYGQELARCYGLHISDETNGTLYSSTFCLKCYVRLAKLRNSAQPSEGILKTAKYQIENAKSVWTPFDSTVEVADCVVCSKFEGCLLYTSPSPRDDY